MAGGVSLRIVTWNCNGAFRLKRQAVDALHADVLVIQECEDPAQSTAAYRDWAGEYLWTGYGKSKGVGIFPRKGQLIEPLDWAGQEYQLFLPARLDRTLTILGVWTQNSKPATYSYIGQFWHFMQSNKARLDESTVILGDFNSNSIWDRPRRAWNHSDCVNALRELSFTSLYHHTRSEGQGQEREPTFYFYRKPEKPFHIDFIFAHDCLISAENCRIQIGDPNIWLSLSDHMPMIADI